MVQGHPDPQGPGPHTSVLKFGGTSVKSVDRWATIADITRRHVEHGFRPILVCSAVSGVSNKLVALAEGHGDEALCTTLLAEIRDTHAALADAMGVDGAIVEPFLDDLEALLAACRTLDELTPRTYARVMSAGELMSTRLGAAYLQAQGLDVAWLDARELLVSDEDGSVPESRRYLSATCDHTYDADVAARLLEAGTVRITQGFIARSADAEDTVLLGRGGSDTSAAYLASRLGAARLEIWTDVAGLYSANPRVIPDARHLDHVHYDTAEALATLGARVLHPRCVGPARDAGIPLYVRSTLDRTAPGTRIDDADPRPGVHAITRRRGLCLFTMRRPKEWQAIGFVADVARCFSDHGFSIDLLSSSPGEIQATIDLAAAPLADDALEQLTAALERVCEVDVLHDVNTVSMVGHRLTGILQDLGPALAELSSHKVGLVVPGANDAHLTFVVRADEADDISRTLHARLFRVPDESIQAVLSPDPDDVLSEVTA